MTNFSPAANCLSLDWSPVPLSVWEALFAQVPRSPLLQSYDYARIIAPRESLRPRWARIRRGEAVIGLVQILEARILFGLFHGLLVDRGPVWLPGAGTEADHRDFWALLARTFPRRPGRRRRILPELSLSPASQALLTGAGFLPRPRILPYQTVWVDLSAPEDSLRARLAGNWRGHLNRAEKNALSVTLDGSGTLIPWMIALYAADRATRRYPGPPPPLVRALAHGFADRKNLLIVRIEDSGGTVLAGGLFLIHGTAATSQVTWVSEEGRRLQAGYLLLWRAMLALKARGVAALDLGGVNDHDAAGIKSFKSGLGGEAITLVGQYS